MATHEVRVKEETLARLFTLYNMLRKAGFGGGDVRAAYYFTIATLINDGKTSIDAELEEAKQNIEAFLKILRETTG